MLRNLIGAKHTTEIFKIGSTDVKRGAIVVKDYTNKVANKASATGVEIFFVDYNFVPSGYQSDMEISAYTDQADIVKAGTNAVLIKPQLGETWALDQVVTTGLAAGDYAIAGSSGNVGKLVKATTGNVATLRYVGEYKDGDQTLYAFEVVEPKTIA
jgi:hypothetical protein